MGSSSRAGKARRPEMARPACRRAQLFVPKAHYGDSIQCSVIGLAKTCGDGLPRGCLRSISCAFLAVWYLLSVCVHSMSCSAARDALVLRPICTRDAAGRVHRPSLFVCLFVCCPGIAAATALRCRSARTRQLRGRTFSKSLDVSATIRCSVGVPWLTHQPNCMTASAEPTGGKCERHATYNARNGIRWHTPHNVHGA